MSRINIENELYTDQRFIDLIVQLGDFEKALGAVVRCWILGQRYWKNSDHGIPISEWKKQKLNNALIDVGLASNVGDFVCVSGAEKHFGWLRTCAENGKKGGKSPGNKKAEIIDEFTKPGLPMPNTDLTSSSSSSSSSNSSSRSRSNSDTNQKLRNIPSEYATPSKNGAHQKIAYFCDCWKEKYKANYAVLPKEAGLIGRSFTGFGQDKFQSLVDAYFQMHDSYFLTKRHDVTTLVMNLAKVSHFAQTGVKVSRHDINQIEIQEHNTNVFTKIAKERAASET